MPPTRSPRSSWTFSQQIQAQTRDLEHGQWLPAVPVMTPEQEERIQRLLDRIATPLAYGNRLDRWRPDMLWLDEVFAWPPADWPTVRWYDSPVLPSRPTPSAAPLPPVKQLLAEMDAEDARLAASVAKLGMLDDEPEVLIQMYAEENTLTTSYWRPRSGRFGGCCDGPGHTRCRNPHCESEYAWNAWADRRGYPRDETCPRPRRIRRAP
jgi:hypothetical protein